MATRIAIAGATGFVGRALALELGTDYRVVGLARNPPTGSGGGFTEWRKTDFLSLLDAERALEDTDVGFYLIHSMMPSAHLSQGRFQDFDLIAADNFARAARARGVKRIIYLGGLVPEGEKLSPHLQSRLEVEAALAAYGTPVTTLRASLIVGPRGSSYVMVKRLVERLPMMICPSWTRNETQPIALKDVVALLRYCAENPHTAGETYDVGGPDIMTYEEMMRELARALGKSIPMLRVPFFTPRLSRLWISVVSGAPASLVRPLIQSLRHRMVARDRRLQEQAGIPGTPYRELIRETLREEKLGPAGEEPVAFVGSRRNFNEPEVSSIQRFRLPARVSATWLAHEYLKWLPTLFVFLLRVEVSADFIARFYLWPWKAPLLILVYSKERSTENRALFYVQGGSFARPHKRGRLEMREVLGRRFLLTTLLEFRPRLPWFIYKFTQAQAHLMVMWAFGRHLQRIGNGHEEPGHFTSDLRSLGP